jgi:type IV pilus assembly protein PilA
MKKKGFTLIELIVVIAIIGVLAAILVPAMLGYVRKSKITTANTTAKSIYNAYNTALVDFDTTDSTLNGSANKSSQALVGADTAKSSETFDQCVYGYFTDLSKVKSYAIKIESGACTACGVMNGNYPGAYPKQWTPEAYKKDGKPSSAIDAMSGPSDAT